MRGALGLNGQNLMGVARALQHYPASCAGIRVSQDFLRHPIPLQILSILFLAVHNSSIGDLVTNSLTNSLSDLLILTFKKQLNSEPRDL